VNHYERLGVPVDARVADIRSAYLRAARRVHPDVAGTGRAAGAQMAAINEAWETLSDADRREMYDLTLPMSVTASDAPPTPQRPPVVRASTGEAFRPLDDADPDESFRYSEDEGDPSTATGAVLTVVLALVAVAAGILAMVVDSGALGRVALVALALCLVSLIAVPMVVMGRAVRHEGRTRRP
jgi:hypothetical protein